MEAAAQTFGLQTDGIPEEWKSANNLYDKVFFFYHRTKHSHHYAGEASHPFLWVYGWLGPFLPEAKSPHEGH